jgi:hypothetical protein
LGRQNAKNTERKGDQTTTDRDEGRKADRDQKVHSAEGWIHLSLTVRLRRKDITLERKKAAEERRRLEEEKAKVSSQSLASKTTWYLTAHISDGSTQSCTLAKKTGQNKED